MRSRTLLVAASAAVSLATLALVAPLTTASAQTPPPGAAGPARGFGGFGGGQGGFGGGGLGQGGLAVAPEPPQMVVDGPNVFVLRRGILYKVDKKEMKVEGQLALGPGGPGGFGGARGGGFGGGGGARGGASGGLGGGQR